MTIRNKLLGNSILSTLFLAIILVGALFVFGGIDKDAKKICGNAKIVKEKANETHRTIKSVSTQVSSVLEKCQLVATQVNNTNDQVKILKRKIKAVSESISRISDITDKALDEIDDDATVVVLEGVADELMDIQDTVKREALISLQSAVKGMDTSKKELMAQVKALSMSNVKLEKGKKLSGESGDAGRLIEKVSKGFNDDLRFNRNALIGVIVFAIACILILGITLTRSILRPLGAEPTDLIEVAEGIANGNLNVAINKVSAGDDLSVCGTMRLMLKNLQQKGEYIRKISAGDLSDNILLSSAIDELGKDLITMQDNLNTVVSDLSKSSNGVNEYSAKILDISTVLSQGATEQVSTLSEISTSVFQIAKKTEDDSNSAKNVNMLASEAAQECIDGNANMQKLINAMDEINSSSSEVSRIVKIIDDIAFQTNLLALNAAVEAARAGRHGKGFAVVAEEVRSLAGRSAKSAKETSELIAVSTSKINTGAELSGFTAESLKKIEKTVNKIDELMTEMEKSTKEQAKGISEVNVGLEHLNDITKQNTLVAEQASADSESMHNEATMLQEIVSQFKLKNEISDIDSVVSEDKKTSQELVSKIDSSSEIKTKIL